MNIVNDKVTEYIYNHYKPLTEELGQLRVYAENNNVPIILRDTETLILNILRLLRPKKILEVGAAIGYSAICFAAAAHDSQVITIERDQGAYEKALSNIAEFNLNERVKCVKGEATDVLIELSEKLDNEGIEPYDFVFIDAGKSHYKEFWECTMKMIRPGSVIICDNVLLKATTVSDQYDIGGKHKTNIRKMREFIEYLTSLESVDTSLLPVGDGVTVSIIK